jgi:hypothetical protein
VRLAHRGRDRLSFISSRTISPAGTKSASFSLIDCSWPMCPIERNVVPPILRMRSAISSVVAKMAAACSSTARW